MVVGATFVLFAINVACLASGQNPCDNNPCGVNAQCLTQLSSGSGRPVISCQCLPGFTQGDPFSGCEPVGGPLLPDSDYFEAEDEEEGLIPFSSTTISTTTLTTTDRPHVFPTRPTVIGFDDSGKKITLHQAPSDDIPFLRNDFTVNADNSPSELDLAKIFTEECLVSEDCPNAEYCDLASNTCKTACSLNICGEKAQCKGRLHRPLCYCPDGYDGNPHVKCEKAKSRAGTRFRRSTK